MSRQEKLSMDNLSEEKNQLKDDLLKSYNYKCNINSMQQSQKNNNKSFILDHQQHSICQIQNNSSLESAVKNEKDKSKSNLSNELTIKQNESKQEINSNLKLSSVQNFTVLDDIMLQSEIKLNQSDVNRSQINQQLILSNISDISSYSSVSISSCFKNIQDEDQIRNAENSFQQSNNQINSNQNNQYMMQPKQQLNVDIHNQTFHKKQDQQQILNRFISKLEKGCNNNQKSIAYILTEIIQGSQKISTDDNTSTLVLGITGSGKTSLAAFLSGLELIVKTTEIDEDFPFIDYQVQDLQRKIGTDDLNSETQIPNKFVSNKGNTIWDCPGFNDSKGVEQDIINSFHMSKIISNSKKINLIITINGPSFEKKGCGEVKGQGLKNLIGTLFSLTQGTNIDFSKNLLIVFTKTKREQIYYKNKLDDQFDQFLSKKVQDKELLKFYSEENIQKFIQKLKLAKVEIFPQPDIKKGNFLPKNKLQLMNSYYEMTYYDGNDINVPFSIDSLRKLEQIWNYSHQILSNTFYNLCQKFVDGFVNFRDEKSLQNVELLILKFHEIDFQSMQPNEQKFNELKNKFINPFLKIVQQVYQNDEDYSKFKEKINEDLEYIEFYLKEVYDSLLCKLNLSQKLNKSIGNFGNKELYNGIRILQQTQIMALKQLITEKFQQEKQQLFEQNQAQISQLKSDQKSLSESKEKYEKQLEQLQQNFSKWMDLQVEKNKKCDMQFEQEKQKIEKELKELEQEKEKEFEKQKKKQTSSGIDYVFWFKLGLTVVCTLVTKKPQIFI